MTPGPWWSAVFAAGALALLAGAMFLPLGRADEEDTRTRQASFLLGAGTVAVGVSVMHYVYTLLGSLK